MDEIAESTLSSCMAKESTLCNLFAKFIGQELNNCIHSEPELDNDLSDFDVSKRNQLKMASLALLKSIDNVGYTDNSGQTFFDYFLEIFYEESKILSADRLAVGLEIIENLLEQGASIDVINKGGFSLLQYLIDIEEIGLLRLILTKLNAFCICSLNNCQDKQTMNRKTLHLNSEQYLIEILQICFAYDIDFNIDTSTSTSPLIALCMFSFFPTDLFIVIYPRVYLFEKLIERYGNINVVDSKGYSALHYAVEKQHIEVLQKLIELGAEVNQSTQDGLTPLYVALQEESLRKTESQCFDKIEVLIKAGANVNIKVGTNVTPLMFAMMNACSLKTVKYLISNGAAVHNQDNIMGFKPIHFAALHYPREVFNHVVDRDFDINKDTDCGLSVLQLASLAGNLKVVKILIERGVNVNYREPTYGLTSTHLVSMAREMFSDLTKNSSSDALTLAAHYLRPSLYCYNDDCDMSATIEYLVRNGADVNAQDMLGMTPMYYATLRLPVVAVTPCTCHIANGVHKTWKKWYDVLLILYRLGADMNRPANNALTPVHNIMQQREISTLGCLVFHGVDWNDVKAEISKGPWILNSLALYSTSKHLIYKYILKLIIAKLVAQDTFSFKEINFWGDIDFVDEMNRQRQIYNNLSREYSEEVKKLKSYYVENNVSLYDWLRSYHTKARPFYLNGVPSELESKFPNYYEIILSRYRTITARIPLLEPAKLAWYRITKINLPEICVEHILSYLNNRYLYILAVSVENENQLG